MKVKVMYVSTCPHDDDGVEFNVEDAPFCEMATDLIDQWDVYRWENGMHDAVIFDVREVHEDVA